MWISVEEVIAFHGLKPKQFNLEKGDDSGLEDIISEWIDQCQSIIETYTNRKYTTSQVPGAVRNVCLRLVGNMVTLAIQKRDSPIIKVNDWSIQTISSNIFTDDLKNDLKPFINDSSNDYRKIGFFAITGKDING